MASVDGKEGVTFEEFHKMWTNDGTKLVEEKKVRENGNLWYLYAIYFPESTYDYGRHMSMILKVNEETQVVLMHDLNNLTGEINQNYRQGIDEWFNEHVGKY